jgi:hypothetical protein
VVNKCQLEKSKKVYSGICAEAGQVGEIPERFVGFSLRLNDPVMPFNEGKTVPTNGRGKPSD